MNFRFILIASLFIALELAPSACAQVENAGLARFLQVKKDAAEFSLTLTCTLDGVFKEQRRTFYFRARQTDQESGVIGSVFSNADGAGGGYGFSARADPRSTAVEVEVSVYWTSRHVLGKSEITFLVPYFEKREGKEAGFSYSLLWEKIK